MALNITVNELRVTYLHMHIYCFNILQNDLSIYRFVCITQNFALFLWLWVYDVEKFHSHCCTHNRLIRSFIGAVGKIGRVPLDKKSMVFVFARCGEIVNKMLNFHQKVDNLIKETDCGNEYIFRWKLLN